MNTKTVMRKLSAIAVLDTVGYSRMMEGDETGTLKRLKNLRQEVVDPAIAKRGGTIVKLTGDGLLAEFDSATQAVRAFHDVQLAMIKINAPLAEEQRLRFRVGINVGEIIHEDNDIYGNGVNVAARLESLSPIGGLCISGTVYEQVRDTLTLGFDDLGEQKVKNITRPIRGYALRVETLPNEMKSSEEKPEEKRATTPTRSQPSHAAGTDHASARTPAKNKDQHFLIEPARTADMASYQTFKIGRGEDADLRLGDSSQGVSRLHAEVTLAADGALHITDRASTNGTFVQRGGTWQALTQDYVSDAERLRFGALELGVGELRALLPKRDLRRGDGPPPDKSLLGGAVQRDRSTGEIVERQD